MTNGPQIIPPGGGRSYAMGRMQAVFKADLAETDSKISVSEWWLEPRTRGPGPHAHEDLHLYYVLEGTLSLLIDETWREAAAGSTIYIPGGTTHCFENRSTARAGFLSLNVPGGFESRMPAIAEALSGEDLRL
jgi:quercetin dioxygenase-like cupin family protein